VCRKGSPLGPSGQVSLLGAEKDWHCGPTLASPFPFETQGSAASSTPAAPARHQRTQLTQPGKAEKPLEKPVVLTDPGSKIFCQGRSRRESVCVCLCAHTQAHQTRMHVQIDLGMDECLSLIYCEVSEGKYTCQPQHQDRTFPHPHKPTLQTLPSS
jgi:hypothetical protein